MGGVRRHKRTWAWLAIIALLSNVLMALAPSKAASLVDDIFGPLVICTANGAKIPQGDGGSGGRTPSDHCPTCTLLAQFVLAVTVIVTAITFPVLAAAIPTPMDLGLFALRLSLGGIRSRAPPLSA